LQIALLFTVPRSKTVKALTNCELNVLSKTALDNVLENFPQFKDKLVTVAEVSELYVIKKHNPLAKGG